MWTIVHYIGLFVCLVPFSLTLIISWCSRLLNYLVRWLLKMCLLFGFTLPLSSPLSLHLFLRPLLISGDGDEEHAILGHGVCQEWGDLWWVILYYFLNTRSVCPQFIKNIAPTQFMHIFPISVAQNLNCCVSNFSDKQGNNNVLHSQSQRSYDWRHNPGPCQVLLMIAVLNVLTPLTCHIKISLRRPQRGSLKEKRFNLLPYVV